jgi:hypothetical protein
MFAACMRCTAGYRGVEASFDRERLRSATDSLMHASMLAEVGLSLLPKIINMAANIRGSESTCSSWKICGTVADG